MDSSLQKQRKPSTSNKGSKTSTTNAFETLPSKLSDLPQQIVSKNWLQKNVQSDWWNELECQQYKINSQFHTANYYELWRKSTLRNKKITGTISEYQACRELLWMFYAPTSMSLLQEEANNKFSIKDISIPSLSSVS